MHKIFKFTHTTQKYCDTDHVKTRGEVAVKKETLYLKCDRYITTTNLDVRLRDVGKLVCTNEAIGSKLKTMLLFRITPQKKEREIISVLKIIEMIQKEYPDIDIQTIGEKEIVVQYVGNKNPSKVWDVAKIIFVSLIAFFGAGFAIMTFNNDVSVPAVFDHLYTLITGEKTDDLNIIECMYSLGLGVGIVLFYNHIGGRNITRDPTPIEVQMRIYEQDVNTALVETAERDGEIREVK